MAINWAEGEKRNGFDRSSSLAFVLRIWSQKTRLRLRLGRGNRLRKPLDGRGRFPVDPASVFLAPTDRLNVSVQYPSILPFWVAGGHLGENQVVAVFLTTVRWGSRCLPPSVVRTRTCVGLFTLVSSKEWTEQARQSLTPSLGSTRSFVPFSRYRQKRGRRGRRKGFSGLHFFFVFAFQIVPEAVSVQRCSGTCHDGNQYHDCIPTKTRMSQHQVRTIRSSL